MFLLCVLNTYTYKVTRARLNGTNTDPAMDSYKVAVVVFKRLEVRVVWFHITDDDESAYFEVAYHVIFLTACAPKRLEDFRNCVKKIVLHVTKVMISIRMHCWVQYKISSVPYPIL